MTPPRGTPDVFETGATVFNSIAEFLATVPSRHTIRQHVAALMRISDRIGPDRLLADVTGDELAAALTQLFDRSAAATWNKRRASVITWLAWNARRAGAGAPTLPTGCTPRPPPARRPVSSPVEA